MSLAISVEHISKQYRLGTIGSGTLSHDLNRWWHKVRGKEDPYLKIGEVNDRSQKSESNYVWALKDVNFQVAQGEVLGIIGKNGAGKSTLLKVLSRVTQPTLGRIRVKGRIASLLEVGTGFHPEMTGRENIFMNGAILGMIKMEIRQKLDEIVAFSGIEKYIDTPVKRYSSGMYVRLAFAVAAHLDPEILVVDEVLAVGDAEFQKKCIGKMQDVAKNEGRTVLFVSHNMAAVQNLCTQGMVMQHGTVSFLGNINDAIKVYTQQFVHEQRSVVYTPDNAPQNEFGKFISAAVQGKDKAPDEVIYAGEALELSFRFDLSENMKGQVLDLTFHLYDEMGVMVFMGSTTHDRVQCGTFEGKAICEIPAQLMHEGSYNLAVLLLVKDRGTALLNMKDVIQFDIMPAPSEQLGWMGRKEGVVKPLLTWQL